VSIPIDVDSYAAQIPAGSPIDRLVRSRVGRTRTKRIRVTPDEYRSTLNRSDLKSLPPRDATLHIHKTGSDGFYDVDYQTTFEDEIRDLKELGIDYLIEVHAYPDGNLVELYGEGGQPDEWGTYLEIAAAANRLGGIFTTVHDGDDECEYLRIGGGMVNRYGAFVVSADTRTRLEQWARTDFDDGNDDWRNGSYYPDRGTVMGPRFCSERWCEPCEGRYLPEWHPDEDPDKITCSNCKRTLTQIRNSY
jgi:hypothetical protein